MTPCEAVEKFGAANVSPGILAKCPAATPVSPRRAEAKARREAASEVRRHWGPRAWEKLHTTAAEWDGLDPEKMRRWLDEVFVLDLANGPCDCRRHWVKLVAANPPDLSSPGAFWRWTVRRHNDVRRRLRQPVMVF